jgi:hypothetical protein
VIKKINKIKKIIYIITTDIKSFFYIIPIKIQALVISCDEFLYVRIIEICCQFIELVFNIFFASSLLPMRVRANSLYFLDIPPIRIYMKNRKEDKPILQQNEACLFGDSKVEEKKGQKKMNEEKRKKKVRRERG